MLDTAGQPPARRRIWRQLRYTPGSLKNPTREEDANAREHHAQEDLVRHSGIGALSATLSAGAGSASAEAQQAKEVHLAVKSIMVLQDGDPGASSGCGEMRAKFDGRLLEDWATDFDFTMDNGTGFKPRPYGQGILVQEYCAGTMYWTNLDNGANKYVTKIPDYLDNVPAELHMITGSTIDEFDGPGQSVLASDVQADPKHPYIVFSSKPGTIVDVPIKVQGTNATGTVDLIVTVRVRVF